MGKTVLESQLTAVNVKKKKSFFSRVNEQKYLFMMSMPVVIWLVIFAYIPLWGWSFAFFKYSPKAGKSVFNTELEWVGLKYFKELFADDRVVDVIKNTVIMNFLYIVFACFVVPIIFALILNEVRSMFFKRTVQTISYLPHFVSWVVVAGMFYQLVSPNGVINSLLVNLHLIKEPITFAAEPKYFYGMVTIASVWKEIGWNAIIYIAAIAGIDPELYEAAAVDGAGRLRRMWNVTLPGIKSTIIILLIINIGSIFAGGFEKQLLFQNATNIQVSQVLDLYVLQNGLAMQRYSFGTAAGMFTSLISLVMVFTTNQLSKKLTGDSLV